MKKSFFVWMFLLAFSLILTGCGGGNSGNNDGNENPQTYTVGGYVNDSNGQGISEVALTFSGDFTGSTNTMASPMGSWSMGGLKGTVTIIPSKSGWSFSPVSKTVTQENHNIVFVGTYSDSPSQPYTFVLKWGTQGSGDLQFQSLIGVAVCFLQPKNTEIGIQNMHRHLPTKSQF